MAVNCVVVVEVPPPLAVAHESVPEPFVDRTWLAVPSAEGSVHVTLEATVAGAWKATQLLESESANLRSP